MCVVYMYIEYIYMLYTYIYRYRYTIDSPDFKPPQVQQWWPFARRLRQRDNLNDLCSSTSEGPPEGVFDQKFIKGTPGSLW